MGGFKNSLLNAVFKKNLFDITIRALINGCSSMVDDCKKNHKLLPNHEEKIRNHLIENYLNDMDKRKSLGLGKFPVRFISEVLEGYDESTHTYSGRTDIRVVSNNWFNNSDDYYKNVDESIQLPNGLNASLRNYQETGFKWLKTLDSYGFGGVLADDMGLGKTIQLVSVILSYVESFDLDDNAENKPKTSLVICPSSLTLNWYNEIKKFAPSLKVLLISGNALERKSKISQLGEYNVAICSLWTSVRIAHRFDLWLEINSYSCISNI